MSVEQRAGEDAGERCEECGAKLTSAEVKAAFEAGGPHLCTVHADEVVPIADDEADFGA